MKCSHEYHRIASLFITAESVLTSVRYKSHMKYIIPMWTKDLYGNLWRYGSYHVHVFLRFSVLVSHTQNRPATLVLLILSLTWFQDLGTSEDTIRDHLWPQKVFGEEFSNETYFFLSANKERAKRWCAKYMDRRIFLSRKLFTQNILNKEGQKQSSGAFRKSDFLK